MTLNQILLKVHLDVMNEHPNAAFYEAQGTLIENEDGNVDGTIDSESFLAAYCLIGNNQTVIAKVDENNNTIITVHASPWIEDMIMTPYVPLEIDDAIMILENKFGKGFVKPGHAVLRFQLFPGEIEPRYFFGDFIGTHTVGVYSGKIDVPLKKYDGDVVPKNNDEFYNIYIED